jgi:hypothetical protein
VQPRPNVVVPLDPSARLRRSTIRPGSGVRGQRGEPGPVGARGPKGAPGAAGPGDTRTFHSTTVYGPFPSGFETTVVTAQSVQPGTWLVQSTVKLRRPSGGEFLSACNITNGLQTWQGTTVAVGADAYGTGMQHATSVATAIVQNELPMDLAVRCSGSRFGGLGADLELYDPVLMVARLPAASSQLRGA